MIFEDSVDITTHSHIAIARDTYDNRYLLMQLSVYINPLAIFTRMRL